MFKSNPGTFLLVFFSCWNAISVHAETADFAFTGSFIKWDLPPRIKSPISFALRGASGDSDPNHDMSKYRFNRKKNKLKKHVSYSGKYN